MFQHSAPCLLCFCYLVAIFYTISVQDASGFFVVGQSGLAGVLGMGSPPRVGPGRLSVRWHKAGPKVGSAPCNPPPMDWQALGAGPVGIASLVCPAGHGTGVTICRGLSLLLRPFAGLAGAFNFASESK